jgi:D-aspartate ligase
VNAAEQGQRAGGQRPDVGGVIIGGDYQGLGIVRSLGQRGVATCVLDDELSIARFSRYATHSMRVEDLASDDALLSALEQLERRFDVAGWVLYPTRDETVAGLSRHRAELAERFRVATPGWDTVRHAWDKRNTYSLARRLDIPVPKTVWPGSGEDLDELAGMLPLAVKPAIKEHFFYATKAKAWRADSMAQLGELIADAQRLIPEDEVMVQEIIPGDGRGQMAYCALMADGEPVAGMTVVRRRQHPPEFGRASTYVVVAEDGGEVERLARRLLSDISYSGLVEVEFKRDPRDGQYKLLDFNARTWGYHTLGAAAGVDFSYLLYLTQIGGVPEPSRATPGVSWVRLLTDVPTAVLELSRRHLSVRDYVASLRAADVEAVFSRADPAPGVCELALTPYLAVKRGF